MDTKNSIISVTQETTKDLETASRTWHKTQIFFSYNLIITEGKKENERSWGTDIDTGRERGLWETK